jgi:hypothetical protein
MILLQKFFDHGYDPLAEELIKELPNVPDSEWLKWNGRELEGNRYEPSIPFLFMQNGVDPREISLVKKFKQLDVLESIVFKMADKLLEKFEGHVTKLMLVKVRPEQESFFHVDPTDTLQLVHRLHMPLVQSDETRYHVGGEEFKMEVGHWYEKNNLLTHAVINRAVPRQTRFSLQCDIYPTSDKRFSLHTNLYPKGN